MKQKKFIVLVAVVLVLVLCFSVFAACNKKKNDGPTGPATYTLHDYIGATPTNWNPHTWETSADSIPAGYAEMGLVDITIAENGTDYKWVYEMATSITDVTLEYAQQGKRLPNGDLAVPADATKEKVYRITLNRNAKWANGEAINADTYIESMKRLLDPKMQNYRAETYYSGDSAIKNASKYFNSEAPIYKHVLQDGAYVDISDMDDDVYYGSMTKGLAFFGGDSFKTYYDYYGADSFALTEYDEEGNPVYEEDEEGDYVLIDDEYVEYDKDNPDHAELQRYSVKLWDPFAKFSKLQTPFGVVALDTPELLEEYKSVVLTYSAMFGDNNPEAWKEWVFYHDGYGDAYDWDGVGYLKVNDYTIDYVLENSQTEFYFLISCTSNFLVYAPLYDSLKTKVGELYTTKYGAEKVENYMSYGPYVLESFQKDKQMTFKRNENWYGWTDGQHVGQFQTTNIVIDVVTNNQTAENLFKTGKLDSLGLSSSQLATYRTSEYLLKTDQTYTFRFIFATDKNKLAALSNDNSNIRILSYKDFRKALSYSMDRAKFAAQGTGGYKPAYSLISSLYYYDVENDPSSIYRNTDPAMQAIVDLYGVEYGPGTNYPTLKKAYDSITGYNLDEAKALFQSAYLAAKAAGDYVDGQKVEIHCMCSAAQELDEDDKSQERLLNEFVTAATVGTGLEGKVSFVYDCGSDNRYDQVAAGEVAMIRGAWGGAAFYPFSLIRNYTDPRYKKGLAKIHESCGWDPRDVEFTLTYDFDGDGVEETETHNLEYWADSINGGLQADDGTWTVQNIDNIDAQVLIMSKLEKAVLESYQCIPWATETACSLFSQKLHYATLDYNIMYGYGGIRLMTYNYSDAEWDAYVKSQGGELNY